MNGYPRPADINMTVPVYLAACYLYYVRDVSLMCDSDFDAMCREMHDRWGEIRHQHKHLVSLGALRAGTGFGIEYPLRVINAANLLAVTRGVLRPTGGVCKPQA